MHFTQWCHLLCLASLGYGSLKNRYLNLVDSKVIWCADAKYNLIAGANDFLFTSVRLGYDIVNIFSWVPQMTIIFVISTSNNLRINKICAWYQWQTCQYLPNAHPLTATAHLVTRFCPSRQAMRADIFPSEPRAELPSSKLRNQDAPVFWIQSCIWCLMELPHAP